MTYGPFLIDCVWLQNCDNGGQTATRKGGPPGCVYEPTNPETGPQAAGLAYDNTGKGPNGSGRPGAENCSTGTQFPVPFEWG
jgi:hypothetical protein